MIQSQNKYVVFFVILLLLAGITHVHANVSLSAKTWQKSLTSKFGEDNTSAVSLNGEREPNMLFELEYVHNVTSLPNVIIDVVEQSTTDEVVLTQTFRLDDQLFNVGAALDSSTSHQTVNAIWYYELFNNRHLIMDAGLGFKQHHLVTAVVQLGSSPLEGKRDVKMFNPVAYFRTKFQLPLLKIGGLIEAKISNKDDFHYKLGGYYNLYESDNLSLQLDAGYMKNYFVTDNLSGVYFNQRTSANYVGFTLTF